MSGYDIADVPNIELSDSEKDLLDSLGADSIQSTLMSEAIIAVDEQDIVLDPCPKYRHTVTQEHTIVHSVSSSLTPKIDCCFSDEPTTR